MKLFMLIVLLIISLNLFPSNTDNQTKLDKVVKIFSFVMFVFGLILLITNWNELHWLM